MKTHMGPVMHLILQEFQNLRTREYCIGLKVQTLTVDQRQGSSGCEHSFRMPGSTRKKNNRHSVRASPKRKQASVSSEMNL